MFSTPAGLRSSPGGTKRRGCHWLARKNDNAYNSYIGGLAEANSFETLVRVSAFLEDSLRP